MAAPAGAYKGDKLKVRNLTNTAWIEHLVAILQVDRATMLARFYLDDYLVVYCHDNTTGVIGIIKANSSNYAYHSAARRGGIPSGQFGILLNDGGLNTFGNAYNTAFNAYAVGNLKLYADYLSAYYVDTTDHGFLYKVDAGSWQTISYGNLSQQATDSREYTFSQLSNITAGQTVYLKAFITNAEGTYEAAQISAVITAKVINAMYTTGWPSQANNAVTVYAADNFNNAFYAEAQLVNKAPDGYYVYGGYWYQQSGGVVVASGVAASGSWPSGDPGNPSVTSYAWEGYSSNSPEDAIADIPGSSFGTLYRNTADNKWYDNYNSSTGVFSSVVTDGYYAKDSNTVKWFVNGYEEMIIG